MVLGGKRRLYLGSQSKSSRTVSLGEGLVEYKGVDLSLVQVVPSMSYWRGQVKWATLAGGHCLWGRVSPHKG